MRYPTPNRALARSANSLQRPHRGSAQQVLRKRFADPALAAVNRAGRQRLAIRARCVTAAIAYNFNAAAVFDISGHKKPDQCYPIGFVEGNC